MAAASELADPRLQEMREAWWPTWCIWRSRNSDGAPNEWCATRRPEGGKPGMTLIEPTADALETALQREPERLVFGD